VGFHEVVAPARPPFRFVDPDAEDEYHRKDVEHARAPDAARSLLREAFEGRHGSEDALVDDDGPAVGSVSGSHGMPSEHTPLRGSPSRRNGGAASWADSLFSVGPSLSSGFGGSYGTMYASARARRESSMVHAAQLFREEQAKHAMGEPLPAEALEQEPLLIRQVEEDGVVYNVVVGQSTLPQTIFNSVNVLIGVGLLSLPLGLLYSGWIVGAVFLVFAAVSTQYTAKLLAKCLDVDNSLITFADLAYVSFGSSAQIATSLLFSIELVAACVALVILFADSLNALFPSYSIVTWKIICGLILIPLTALPLRLLSFTSVLGILSCLGSTCFSRTGYVANWCAVVVAVFIDGLIKDHQPGSLREPARTYMFPLHWQTIPLAFGLLMCKSTVSVSPDLTLAAPWGGHSVFPNIYRDMRHPFKYHRAVDTTYAFTFLLDSGMAVIGLLMFGDNVHDEITSNILLTPGYPPSISILIVVCIAIIPITKLPLNMRPIVSTIEVLTGLNPLSREEPSMGNKISRLIVRLLVVVIFVVLAIIFPSFDRIMTLLGSVCCFSICIILPVAFHLKLFGKELGTGEMILNWSLAVVSTIMAVVSTIFACLPRDVLNGEV
jgi:vesicular inhibitory amino acid transporter